MHTGYFHFLWPLSVKPKDGCIEKFQQISSFINTPISLCGTNNHASVRLTYITFLHHCDAQFELQQVFVTMSLCLVPYICTMWLADYMFALMSSWMVCLTNWLLSVSISVLTSEQKHHSHSFMCLTNTRLQSWGYTVIHKNTKTLLHFPFNFIFFHFYITEIRWIEFHLRTDLLCLIKCLSTWEWLYSLLFQLHLLILRSMDEVTWLMSIWLLTHVFDMQDWWTEQLFMLAEENSLRKNFHLSFSSREESFPAPGSVRWQLPASRKLTTHLWFFVLLLLFIQINFSPHIII